MTFNQYLAIFIATYMLVFPVLGWLVPNVPTSHRGGLWRSLGGFMTGEWHTRAFCALVTVLCFWLWNTPDLTSDPNVVNQTIQWQVPAPKDK